MSNEIIFAVYLTLCLWSLLLTITFQVQCPYFYFPTIQTGILTARENSAVNITFHLVEDSCAENKDLTINIGRFYLYECRIHQRNGKCIQAGGAICGCTAITLQYWFIKTVNRTDRGQWTWWVSAPSGDQRLAQGVIILNITYPSLVTRLLIDGKDSHTHHVVPRNKPMNFVCTWEIGNPPTTLRLLNSQGKNMAISDSDRNISYTHVQVSCQETGLIRCEADGSERNMTTTLLVECPPIIDATTRTRVNYTAIIGENVHFTFQIRSHTSHISDCQVAQNHVKSSERNEVGRFYTIYGCRRVDSPTTQVYSVPGVQRTAFDKIRVNDREKCQCSVSGIIPYLTLDVTLFDVTLRDSGLWRVTVSNTIGQDETETHLYVSVGPPRFKVVDIQTHTIPVGQTALFTFPVHIQTSQITECQLLQYLKYNKSDGSLDKTFSTVYICRVNDMTENEAHDLHEEKCRCSVNGNSPDFMLLVHIYDITNKHGGRWRVTVRNEVGADHIDVFLLISKEEHVEKKWQLVSLIALPLGCLVLIASIRYLHRKNGNSAQKKTCQPSLQEVYTVSKGTTPTMPETSCDNALHCNTQEEEDETSICTVQDMMTKRRHETTSVDSNIKFLCQSTDVTKIVFHIRGQQSSTEALTPIESDLSPKKADYLTPSASQYTTLKSKVTAHNYGRQYSTLSKSPENSQHLESNDDANNTMLSFNKCCNNVSEMTSMKSNVAEEEMQATKSHNACQSLNEHTDYATLD